MNILLFRILFLTILSLQLLLSSQIELNEKEKEFIKNHSTIIAHNDQNYAPFNFLDDGKVRGYSIDILNLIAKKLGLKIEYKTGYTWSEYIDMLKNKEIDLIGNILITDERKEFITFTKPILVHSTSIISHIKSPIKDLNELNNKTVAVVKGWWHEDALKKEYPNIKILLVDEPIDALKAVSHKQAVATLNSGASAQYLWNENNIVNLTLSGDAKFLENKTSIEHIGIRKDWTLLRSAFDKAMDSLTYDEMNQIKKRWFGYSFVNSSNIILSDKEKIYLSKKDKIKMCVLPNWLPFEQIDKNMHHKGIGADLLALISKKIDKEFVLVPTKTWDESLKNIRARECDILPVAMDVQSRRDAMNFTKPYVKEPFVIATTNDKFYIRDINELSNKKIGIVKSYAFIEVLKKQNPLIDIVAVKNTKVGLEKVLKGELYGYLDTMPTIGYFIQKYGLFNLKIAGKLSSTIDLSIASRSDEPLLNDIIQKALDTISEDEIRTIVGRWIEIKVQQEFDYEKLFYVIAFFSLIFIIVLYKNSSINRINKKLEKANYEILDAQKMIDKYVMILTTDLDGNIATVNDAYCETVGFSKNELIGENFTALRHHDMKDEFFSKLWDTISKKDLWIGEIKNLTKDKNTLYFRVIIEPLYNDKCQKIGYRSISENITDKKRIEELSITDSLTKLNNRLKVDEILEKQTEIFYRYKTPFSVVLFDLDDFKKINDTYGHDVGDYALKSVAKIVQANIRKIDETGRWGGEEFIVICPNTSCENGYILAENIRKAIEEYDFKKIGKLTISLGVTQFRQNDTIQTLFKRVDKCLYDAKNSGKNKTVKD